MESRPDLAKRRKDELGLSQEHLAILLGVTQGTVSRNETADDPDKRFVLSLDALAARKALGEDLAATADALALAARQAAA